MQTSKRLMRRVKTFSDRFPYIGPTAWIASLQYFVVQFLTARAWTTQFNFFVNPISDLGNTVCGQYFDRYVCSPLHVLMNLSFLLLGITMMIGSVLIYQEFKETNYSAVGFGFMALSAFGTMLIGLFPENTISAIHFAGALLPFLLGNLGMIILSQVLELPAWLRNFTLFLGLLGLAALPILAFHTRLDLSIGGIERIVAYPQTIWLIVFGVYISRDHYMTAKAGQNPN